MHSDAVCVALLLVCLDLIAAALLRAVVVLLEPDAAQLGVMTVAHTTRWRCSRSAERHLDLRALDQVVVRAEERRRVLERVDRDRRDVAQADRSCRCAGMLSTWSLYWNDTSIVTATPASSPPLFVQTLRLDSKLMRLVWKTLNS